MVSAEVTNAVWCLSGRVDPHEPPRQIPINVSPFRVGRRKDNTLCLAFPSVSNLHAEFVLDGDRLQVVDLGSTNGTFVNGRRIESSATLQSGDIVQFANVPFRARCEINETGSLTLAENTCDQALALVQFDRLLTERLVVTPHFQPIVCLKSGAVKGLESLARSRLFGLKTPQEMFAAASQLQVEADLSRLLRDEALVQAARLTVPTTLFLNTHPCELNSPLLLESLRELRFRHPTQAVVLEIHESAATNVTQMKRLRTVLRELQMGLAYDDFGAGQARLVELVNVPPDYLKFDRLLIENLTPGAGQRQQVLASLVRMAHDLGVQVVAEGVETKDEAEACRELEFDLGQGYFYGYPVPVNRVSFDPVGASPAAPSPSDTSPRLAPPQPTDLVSAPGEGAHVHA